MQVIKQRTATVPIDTLLPSPENVNLGDVGAISQSIEANAWFGSVLVQESSGTIIAGEHRWRAAKALGASEIPVTYADVDDDRARRIRLADNRTAHLAHDDPERLAHLLQELAATPASLSGTGYDGDALDELLADLGQMQPELAGDPDAVPEAPAEPITQPGDLLILGPHRVVCGDCRAPATVARVLAGRLMNVVITSPPYAAQRDYDRHSGFVAVPPDRYIEWYQAVAAIVAAHLAPNGSYFLNIKEHCEDGQRALYVKDLTLAHVREWGWLFVDEFCWRKAGDGVPGRWPNRFRNAWEPVFHFSRQGDIKLHPYAVAHESHGTFRYADNVARKRPNSTGSGFETGFAPVDGMALPSNVIDVAESSEAHHPAAYPVALPAWFIRAYADPGDAIFDPFMGSGTTLVAAEQQGRIAYGCEISPAYCDVIVQRFKDLTGIEPIRESSARDLEMVK